MGVSYASSAAVVLDPHSPGHDAGRLPPLPRGSGSSGRTGSRRCGGRGDGDGGDGVQSFASTAADGGHADRAIDGAGLRGRRRQDSQRSAGAGERDGDDGVLGEGETTSTFDLVGMSGEIEGVGVAKAAE